jgi:uncharacterized membrane protein YgcG
MAVPASRLRALLCTAVIASLVGLLAALPAVPAQASSPSITAISPTGVETLLGQTPLTTLNVGQLTEVLSKLPGLQGVEAGALKEALSEAIETLSEHGGNLQELLSGSGANELQAKLEEALGVLSPVLETLLGGNVVTKLTEALKGEGISSVLGELLGKASQPQSLIAEILGALNPTTVEGLLGSKLTGEPFSKLNVGELANDLGTTSEGLATDVGQSTSELPATAMALTAPLTSGKELAVLNGLKGITLGLLGTVGEALGGGSGGSGGSGSSGGSGGSGSSGGSGGGTTVVLDEATPASTTPSTAAKSPVGKLKLISHKVKGDTATIVVQVPAAGYLKLSGKDTGSVRRETAKPERVTLTAKLTRAGVASLRRHDKRMKVSLKVAFKPTSGASSSATLSVLYR